MASQNIISFFAPETESTPETGDTPEPLDTNYKEYENLNGYYIKIIYINKEFSIIAYNIDSLDGIRYEIKMKLKDLYKLSNIFKELRTIEEIY